MLNSRFNSRLPDLDQLWILRFPKIREAVIVSADGLKGVVHFKKNFNPKMSSKMSMSFFLQSKRNKVFDENIPGFSPYNGLHWEPNGSRSK